MRPEVFDALPLEERDRVMVERLRAIGEDLGATRRVTHTLQFPAGQLVVATLYEKSWPAEDWAKELLWHFGFSHRETENKKLPNGTEVTLVYLDKMQTIELDSVQRSTRLLLNAANRGKGIYLGWQTQSQRALDDR